MLPSSNIDVFSVIDLKKRLNRINVFSVMDLEKPFALSERELGRKALIKKRRRNEPCLSKKSKKIFVFWEFRRNLGFHFSCAQVLGS